MTRLVIGKMKIFFHINVLSCHIKMVVEFVTLSLVLLLLLNS